MSATSIVGAIALATALAVAAMGADATIKAEVQHAHAAMDSGGGTVTYKLSFDLKLLNQSTMPLPAPGTWTSDDTVVFVIGMQAKLPLGSWTSLFQASWYGLGDERYEPCAAIPPAGTKEVVGITKKVSFLRTRLPELGNEPTVRLYLMLSCRQPGGSVISPSVLTEGFRLSLPPLPNP